MPWPDAKSPYDSSRVALKAGGREAALDITCTCLECSNVRKILHRHPTAKETDLPMPVVNEELTNPQADEIAARPEILKLFLGGFCYYPWCTGNCHPSNCPRKEPGKAHEGALVRTRKLYGNP